MKSPLNQFASCSISFHEGESLLADEIAKVCFRSLLTADSGKNRFKGRFGFQSGPFIWTLLWSSGGALLFSDSPMVVSRHRSPSKGISPSSLAGIAGKAVYPGLFMFRRVSS